MNTVALARYIAISPDLSTKERVGRYGVIYALIAIAVFGGDQTRNVFWETIASAYISVTVFVAATLLVFFGLEYLLRIDTSKLLKKHRKYQIPVAAVLGALPGCGGAIIVMTQYRIGQVGFGAVVAVLTSTMGDAAFLLIAKEPQTGLMIMGMSIFIGIVSGAVVEKIHGYDFLRVDEEKHPLKRIPPFRFGKLNWPWFALLAPGFLFGMMSAFQIDIDSFFGVTGIELTVGAAGAVLSLALWFINPCTSASYVNRTDEETADHVFDKTTTDSCFVTVWVVIAFLLYELSVLWASWDLRAVFATAGAALPMFGVLVGFIPGCGPQVLTASLYLQGVIPLSAQIGNSISNDGDALFPALAVAPKASLIATFYTAIPAVIAGYGWFFLIER
ncbi:MAG: putative manganese transporter [Pseudomonadota bacterium]